MTGGRKSRYRRGARLRAVVSLLAYLAAALGFPLPAPAAKPGGVPFPCQNHACGCRTAEECWRHCCCFTAEERWSWARQHGVEPPPYAERPAARGWNEPRQRDRAAAARSEPKSDSAPATCCDGCCSAKKCCAQTTPSRPDEPKPAPKPSRWSASMSPLQCRGVDLAAAGGAVSLVPPTPITGRPSLSLLGWLHVPDAVTGGDRSPPSPPPPRLSLA